MPDGWGTSTQATIANYIFAQLSEIKTLAATAAAATEQASWQQAMEKAANVLTYLEKCYPFFFNANMDDIIVNYNAVKEKLYPIDLENLGRIHPGIFVESDSVIFAKSLHMKSGNMNLRPLSTRQYQLFDTESLTGEGETFINLIIDTINNIPNVSADDPETIFNIPSVKEIFRARFTPQGGGAMRESNISHTKLKNKQTRNRNKNMKNKKTKKKNRYNKLNKLTRKKIKNMKNKKLKKRQTINKKKQTRNKKKTTRKR